MGKIIEAVIGNLEDKKEFRDNEARAKALPAEYREAYKDMKKYIFNTSGIVSMEPLISLVDLLEEAAADGKKITDITGPDVAAFLDELVRGTKTWQDQQREKLNKTMKK